VAQISALIKRIFRNRFSTLALLATVISSAQDHADRDDGQDKQD
jgi:hypothetical protein